MENFKEVFKREKSVVIGMIHVDALPGTPRAKHPIATIVEHARKEAHIYVKAGVDAIMIENMHDIPYLNTHVGPEITAAMTVIGYEVRKISELPCGIQILAAANTEALAVALAAGLQFVRVEGFVFAHVADEGLMNSCAGELLRYRKQIGAEHILVFTDIKKKHSAHAITADVDIVETAKAAEYFLSDGVIVTGIATGSPADVAELKAVQTAVKIPVLVGSGVTEENVTNYIGANALIVGSYFKRDGHWMNTVDYEKTAKFMEKVKTLRQR
jgi:membrane complex biogenesis BtpA family protein